MKIIVALLISLISLAAYANGGGGFDGRNKFGVIFMIELQICEYGNNDNIYECNFKEITIQNSRGDNLAVSVNCYLENPQHMEFTVLKCPPLQPNDETSSSTIKLTGGSPFMAPHSIRYEIDHALMKKENTEEYILSCRSGCNDYVPKTFRLWQPED